MALASSKATRRPAGWVPPAPGEGGLRGGLGAVGKGGASGGAGDGGGGEGGGGEGRGGGGDGEGGGEGRGGGGDGRGGGGDGEGGAGGDGDGGGGLGEGGNGGRGGGGGIGGGDGGRSGGFGGGSWQAGSSASIRPLQSLSMPSKQLVSYCALGRHSDTMAVLVLADSRRSVKPYCGSDHDVLPCISARYATRVVSYESVYVVPTYWYTLTTPDAEKGCVENTPGRATDGMS